MATRVDLLQTRRVIALLPAGSAVRLHLADSVSETDGAVHLVSANSGYEAAAELLSGPASALLVDLGRLRNGHTALLKLAAKLEVPVVAFGAVSAALNGEALRGVRLVGPEQVARTIAGLAAAPAEGEPAPKAPPRAEPVEQPPPPAAAAPEDATYQAETPGTPDADLPGMRGGSLTQEELDALLKDSL